MEDIALVVSRGLGLKPLEKSEIKVEKYSLSKAWYIPSWGVIAGV